MWRTEGTVEVSHGKLVGLHRGEFVVEDRGAFICDFRDSVDGFHLEKGWRFEANDWSYFCLAWSAGGTMHRLYHPLGHVVVLVGVFDRVVHYRLTGHTIADR